jgi:hypothetical protein
MATPAGSGLPLSLAAAIAAGNTALAGAARGWGWEGDAIGQSILATSLDSARVLAVVLATLVPAYDPLWAGAADLVTAVMRKALAGAAVSPALVLAVGALLGRGAARSGPKERRPEYGAPSGAAGAGGSEEASHGIEDVVIHLPILHRTGASRCEW